MLAMSILLLLALQNASPETTAPAAAPAAEAAAVTDLDTPNYLGYPAQDALSYGVAVEVHPDGTFSGSIRYHFRMLEDADAIYLDFVPSEDWKVEFHDMKAQVMEGNELKIERGEAKVRLSRPFPYEKGKDVFFSATFSGKPVHGLYRERNRHGTTYVFTDHFSTRGRHWLPLEDANTDRAAWKISLKIPPGWEALGSGWWDSLDEAGREYVGETQADIPPSLFAFAAGPFTRVAEAGDVRLVPHYIFPQDVSAAKEGLKHHGAWMALMEENFGPYQYAKYTTAQIPTRWGGVEYPGNVWLSQHIFRGRDHGMGTLAHEFAHMWFGDGVGYADWQDAWLAEGFASYFGPWLSDAVEESELGASMRGVRDRWRRAKNAHALPIRWAEYTDPDQMYGRASANTYQKGAFVLHMLRQEIGDAAFFGGIRTWYLDHLNQATDSASLVAAVSKAANRDMSWFFTQWLDRPGAPTLSWKVEGEVLHLTQSQDAEAFRLRIPVRWQEADGNTQEQVVEMSDKKATLSLGAGATAVQVDPEGVVLYMPAG